MLVQFAVADTPDVNSVKLDPLTFGRHAEETILPLEGARPRPSRHDSVLRGKDIVNDEALGRMFNGVLFNESSPEKQKEIADQIVDEGYVQHNKLVETGREGLLAFARYVFQAVPDTRNPYIAGSRFFIASSTIRSR